MSTVVAAADLGAGGRVGDEGLALGRARDVADHEAGGLEWR